MKINLLVLTILALFTHSPVWGNECELFERVVKEGLDAIDSPSNQDKTGAGLLPNLEDKTGAGLLPKLEDKTGAGLLPKLEEKVGVGGTKKEAAIEFSTNQKDPRLTVTSKAEQATRASVPAKGQINLEYLDTQPRILELKMNVKDPNPSYTPDKDSLYNSSYFGETYSRPKGYQYVTHSTSPEDISIRLPSDNVIGSKVKQTLEYAQNPEAVVLKSLPAGQQSPSYYTHLDSGGLNHVYLTHSNPVPKSITPGSEEHLKWALENGKDLEVKKVFIVDGMKTELEYYRHAKRDIAMVELLKELTSEAKLNGKPFIRMAKTNILEGTQEFVKGMKANDLRKAQEIFMQGPGKSFVIPRASGNETIKMTYSEAEKLLKNAGFVKNGKVDLDQVNEQLSAVEQFYKDTHEVAKSTWKNELGADSYIANPNRPKAMTAEEAKAYSELRSKSNSVSGKKYEFAEDFIKDKGQEVGFDYNRGQNVIWSPSERMFVIIDA